MAGELAPYRDGIPVVADATTRDALFPLATRVQNQRVHRLDTGTIERWSASAWVAALSAQPVFIVSGVGDGIADDTTAIQTALTAANSAGGGIVTLPVGTFLCGDLVAYANTTIQGAGWGTKLQKKAGATYVLSVNPGSGGTTSVSGNASNIVVRDLWMAGLSASVSVSQSAHLLNLNAVSDVLVERMKFTSFESDAIYLGSSNVAATERHNERVTIRKCLFDGVNKVNRNAISIIDGDTVTIEDCYFTRCTDPTQPGAIDIEPDANAFARIKHITIRHCRFQDIGGNVAVIGMVYHLGQAATTAPQRDILIEHCYLDTFTSNAFVFSMPEDKTDAIAPNGIVVRNCTATTGERPFTIDGVKDITFEGCVFRDLTKQPLLSLTKKCQDVKLLRNLFERIDSTSGAGLGVYAVDRLDIDRNTFSDFGTATASAITFTAGTSSVVRITRNIFRSPTGKMTKSVTNTAHTFTPANNKIGENVYLNSIAVPGSQFQPYEDGRIGADVGDAGATFTAVWNVTPQTVLLNTAPTAARTMTLGASYNVPGAKVRVVRGASAGGGFNWAIQDSSSSLIVNLAGLKTWADIAYDPNTGVPRLIGYGTLP